MIFNYHLSLIGKIPFLYLIAARLTKLLQDWLERILFLLTIPVLHQRFVSAIGFTTGF